MVEVSICWVTSTKIRMSVQRVMNARQFGLKLIANVTYGYTSAGFSGRMPMAEIADSIVQVTSPSHICLAPQHQACPVPCCLCA